MNISRICALLFVASLLTVQVVGSTECRAAEADDEEQIYLDVPREPPPVKDVRRRPVKQVYPDDSTRMEFEVIQLSDDTFVNDGPYVEYYRDGQKFQEGMFKRGAMEGEWTFWYPNGQVCKKVAFHGSKPDGQWEVYREDGTKKELQSYTDGRRDGKWMSFYPDGESPMVEFTYQDGEVTGKRIAYFENGNKKQEVHLKKGKMHGPLTQWDESGNVVSEADFVEGKRVPAGSGQN